jgi:hypothetical protein
MKLWLNIKDIAKLQIQPASAKLHKMFEKLIFG